MRIAIVYDRILRPDTTGVHAEKALRALGHEVFYHAPLVKTSDADSQSSVFQLRDLSDLPPGLDLYLQIDDDISYPGPTQFHPNAYWCIDSHRFNSMMGGWTRAVKAQGFDHIYCTQKDGLEQFRAAGHSSVAWLPLAFTPDLHYRIPDCPKRFDWCFVGNILGGRSETLQSLQSAFPNCFVGRAYGQDMVRVYNESKLIVNLAVGNDINMRVFEALACGGLLLTSRVNNGEEELFGEKLVTFSNEAELFELMRWFLTHENERAALALRQYEMVLSNHTYRQRMDTLLHDVVHKTVSAPQA
jgi:hypothetical protein